MSKIVDTLIAERASRLMARPILWAFIRPALYKILHYEAASQMADTIGHGTGRAAFTHVSALLKTEPRISGIHHIPKTGPVIIMANHPTGLADGIYVFDALSARRRDLKFLANADALRVIPAADDIIIPVEWVKAKRSAAKTKATLLALRKSIKDERAIVIFPSGVPAKKTNGILTDGPWMPTAAAIARKHNVPIIPLYIKAENSTLYYVFERYNRELKDITLFREMLNKQRSKPELVFGALVNARELSGTNEDITRIIRESVLRLKADL